MHLLVRLTRMKQRHERVLGIECLLQAIAIGFGLCTLFMFLNRWMPLRPFWLAVGLPLVFVWPVVRWARVRKSLFRIACDLDRRYQLQERLSTAVELQAHGESEGITVWQIADAQAHLDPIPVREAYPVNWWRQARFVLLSAAILCSVWFLPAPSSSARSLTQDQRTAIRDQLTPLAETASDGQDFRATLASVASATTVDAAQKTLGKLRGEAEEEVEQQISTLVEEIQALSISDTLKADLLKFAEQAGSLPQAQANARLAELKVALPEEIASQIATELQALDANRRSLEALIAGVRELQHELANQNAVALNQDGAAGTELGDLRNQTDSPLTVKDPGKTLVLDNTGVPDGNSILTQGADAPDTQSQGFLQNDGDLVIQEGVAIAIPKERIPKHYQKPIETYLRQIALIQP